jgi:FAD/FMN-containing dehydrogenase
LGYHLLPMATEQLIDVSGRAVGQKSIQQLQTSFGGELISPQDNSYESARRIWNASIDKYPGLIARCSGTTDVVTAIRFARENQVLVAVRGGGHNVGGRALCDGGMVVDLSRMKGIRVDPHARTVWVQGGATLGDLDRETHLFGLAVPTGIVSKTGIGGLALGGGVGWLVRKYGLTCDNLLACDVVTADGQVRLANETENEDLFWALRGGGGNFGVVTAMHFRLHPIHTVLGGMVIYPRSRAVEVLRFYRDLTGSAPDELTAYAIFLTGPDGQAAIAVAVCYCGDVSEGEKLLRPLRQFGPPAVDAIQPLPFPRMQMLLDGACPDGNQNYWKSAYLRELSDDAIDTLVLHSNKSASPLTAVVIECHGGAASRVGVADTAFAHREAKYFAGILGQWVDRAESPRHIHWAREFANSLQPHASTGHLLNALGEESDAVIKAAFGENYSRLAQVKKRYDPDNFFRVNQNIRPASEEGLVSK